jgi:hypothetical protein
MLFLGGDAICAVGNVNDTSSRDSANVTSEDYGTSVIAEIKNCTFNGTSPYTEKDYARYSATAQAVMALNAKIDTYDDTSQVRRSNRQSELQLIVLVRSMRGANT